MFKKIKIKNFQAHKSLDLPLEDLVFFTGPSDVGKSAILRAIYWLAGLYPVGVQKLITRGHKTCSVSIQLDNDIWVEKIATIGGDGISYKIIYPDGSEKLFQRVGNTVPEEVAILLRLTDINIQQQFDPHFLISKTPSEIYNILNEHFDLSIWDTIKGRVTKELNQRRTQKRIIEDDHTKIRSWLSENYKKNQAIEELSKIYEQKIKQLTSLKDTASKLQNLTSKIESVTNKVRILSDLVNKYNILYCVKVCKKYILHTTLIQNIDNIQHKLLKSYVSSIVNTQDTLSEKKEAYVYLLHKLRTLYTIHLVKKVCEVDSALQSTSHSLKELQSMLEGAKICPACKRPLED